MFSCPITKKKQVLCFELQGISKKTSRSNREKATSTQKYWKVSPVLLMNEVACPVLPLYPVAYQPPALLFFHFLP